MSYGPVQRFQQKPERMRFSQMSLGRKFIYFWWIVPRVQYDLADLDYQLYSFEVFHQDWRTRLAHYFTIPAIAFFGLMFLAQFTVDGQPFLNGALAGVAVLGLLHLRWCLRIYNLALWALTVGLLVVCWLGATVFYQWAALPDSPWWAPVALVYNPLLWLYVFSFIETLSHALEPVPPYASGSDQFVSTREFFDKGGWYRVAGLLALPTLYTVTSLISNLHLLPTLAARMLASAGFMREHVASLERLARTEWASGQPTIHRLPIRLASWTPSSSTDTIPVRRRTTPA